MKMPIRRGDKNETVRLWRATMFARFGGDTGLYARVHGVLPQDTNEYGPRAIAWNKEWQFRVGKASSFDTASEEVSDDDLRALGIAVPPLPPPAFRSIFFSINGAGSTWNMGYGFDIGEEVKKRGDVYHQPIGYDTRPVPMDRGVDDGEEKFVFELERPRPEFGGRNCETIPWQYNFYSMGALVGCRVLARVLFGDLQKFKWTYLGGSTFGNPRRQMNHAHPGCSHPSGEGIATPTDENMPDEHWDLVADKAMPGSNGDDLYTKMADDENAQTVKNMRAVWDIVNKMNPMNLAAAVLMLLAKPSFAGGYAAAVAAFKALDFFVVKQTGPHVRYQFINPIKGDPRDCWLIALDHALDLANRCQPVFRKDAA